MARPPGQSGALRLLLALTLLLVLPFLASGFLQQLQGPSRVGHRWRQRQSGWAVPAPASAAAAAAAIAARGARGGRQQQRQQQWRLATAGDDEDEDGVKEEERVGPGAPEGYWTDAENIKQELQVFFTVREAEEQRLLAQKQSNPLRAYLGLSDEEQKRIQKRDALIDRDLYSDLRRYGFDYLVLPIMEQGGFRIFRELFSTGGDDPPREEDTGGLALGQALEEKLSKLSETLAAAEPSSTTSDDQDRARPASPGERLSYMQDDAAALDPSGWRKGKTAAAAASAGSSASASSVLADADWSLSNPMKLYMAVGALALAVGFGKGTGGAIDRGFLTPETLASVRLAAEGAIVANVMSTPLGLLLLLQAGKPFGVALPMALKALVGGPAALIEYRLTGEFEQREAAAAGTAGGAAAAAEEQ